MKTQRGFTAFELFVVVGFGVGIIAIIGVISIAVHFISKSW